MKHRSRLFWSLVLFGASASLIAAKPTVSPVQSPLRPLGYPLFSQVYAAGSDSASQAFMTYEPQYLAYVQKMLPETVAFTGVGLNQLDPQRLYFLFDYAPRVYFLYEGACYNNALGATIATASAPTNAVLQGNTGTIFPNTHYSNSWICASGSGRRSISEPLQPGDFVQLPTVKAGQQLSFFVMSNMDSNGNPANVFYNGKSVNSDNYPHMIAFFPDNNSQYIIIGFEDMLNGGDKDANDVVYVVDVGPMNAQALRNPNTLPK